MSQMLHLNAANGRADRPRVEAGRPRATRSVKQRPNAYQPVGFRHGYARAAIRRRPPTVLGQSTSGEFPGAVRLHPRRLPDRGLPGPRQRTRCARGRAYRKWQDRCGGVRDPPGARHGPQSVLHHADQGAVQSEVPRPRGYVRRGPGGSAHRRRLDQRSRRNCRDDDRSLAQHGLRGFLRPDGSRLRRPGRGALPRRPRAGCGVGGADHPTTRVGGDRRAVGDGQQRRGVRRLDGHGARRHAHRARGAPARSAVAAGHGQREALRPVQRPRPAAGEPRVAAAHGTGSAQQAGHQA